MTLLGTFSLIAFNCHFHEAFTQSPAGYMFHLIYFRSHHCDSFVDWSLFGIDLENITNLIEPEIPREVAAVTRTFWIAMIQTIFSFMLVITALNMLGIKPLMSPTHVDNNKFYSYQLQRNSTIWQKHVDGLIGLISLP